MYNEYLVRIIFRKNCPNSTSQRSPKDKYP
jgi:hypothetical protein